MRSAIQTIYSALHPDPYPQTSDRVEGLELLLVRPSWLGAKYALAVAMWRDELPVSQLGRIRRAVDSAVDASFFSGCGLFILWIGPSTTWQHAPNSLKSDTHGLRSTIVQGLIWLDPDTGNHHISRSSWGPIKFGNLQGQVSEIEKLLRNWPPNQQG